MFFLIIILLIVFVLTCICWLLLYFPLNWILGKQKSKKKCWIFSIIAAIGLSSYFLFTSPAYNYEEATLVTKSNQYELILRGERSYMAHDPITALSRQTFTDTIVLVLPPRTGIIQGKEIQINGANSWNGKINITGNNVKIDLSYRTSEGKSEEFDYNGNYHLN